MNCFGVQNYFIIIKKNELIVLIGILGALNIKEYYNQFFFFLEEKKIDRRKEEEKKEKKTTNNNY